MSQRLAWVVLSLSVLLGAWFSYVLRFQLIESEHWLQLCSGPLPGWLCQVRSTLGLLIYWQLLAWAALSLALLGFVIKRRAGWLLAAAALWLAVPALILYSASLAVFALVLALLRLVRASS